MGILYNIKSSITGWFGDVKVYKYPFFVLMGHTAYKINGKDQREILSTLKPGDVLLRRYDHYISGLMIPGYFTHSAMYVGNNDVIHMLGDGVTKEDILTFMRCDDLTVLRYKDETTIETAIRKALVFYKHGVEYDYDFDPNCPKRLYCTEFSDACFGYIIRDKYSGKFIYPDDYLKATEEFDRVWRSKHGKK